MDTSKLRKIAQDELEMIKNNEKNLQTEKKKQLIKHTSLSLNPKDNFDVDMFLKNYVPASPENVLNERLKNNKKLKGYQVLSKKTINNMVIGKTYIKYIKNTVNYDMKYLQSGGILIDGGTSQKNGFKHLENPADWTHLMLKLQKGDNNTDAYVFVIKILNFHIFYKLFDEVTDNNTMREFIVQLQNSDINTLVPSKVKRCNNERNRNTK
jgi:hypothetical protein